MWAELRFVNGEPGGTYRKHNAFLKLIIVKNLSTHHQSVQILGTNFFRNVFHFHKCLASYVTVGHTEALDVSMCNSRRFMLL